MDPVQAPSAPKEDPFQQARKVVEGLQTVFKESPNRTTAYTLGGALLSGGSVSGAAYGFALSRTEDLLNGTELKQVQRAKERAERAGEKFEYTPPLFGPFLPTPEVAPEPRKR